MCCPRRRRRPARMRPQAALKLRSACPRLAPLLSSEPPCEWRVGAALSRSVLWHCVV